ncbi:MAG: DNA translocase FtsK [Verrucomicrobia bacterium]|nr:DNA translocase FtsK [Verrucomicrobiota bacterium]MDE3099689.1 DNA translocase FtsK [Verrucomicrobiota bacterium]
MSRRISNSHNGLHDVIGVGLLALALLLFLAQISFDPRDISHLAFPPNKSAHNWIGPLGAYLAWSVFLPFGLVAYLVPPLLGFFGAAYLLNFLSYLRERLRWSLLWTVMLLVALTGLFYVLGLRAPQHHELHETLAWNAGGALGWFTYGQTAKCNFGLALLGAPGAIIVYATLGLISLLFLTNFQLGLWVRALLAKNESPERAEQTAGAADDENLERRKHELEKQARKLQEEVERIGLGADLQPVPEPTVRDLSVPQSKGPRIRKTTLPSREISPADEGEVIPAKEVTTATTADILGKPPEFSSAAAPSALSAADAKDAASSPAPPTPPAPEAATDAAKPESEVQIHGIAQPRPKPKKPKPITVSATPVIGNYQLPSLDFLQQPDLSIKPTESREELMANARLMQQTLAQFDIEVSLGDITKGPTITRYELHPAPGVKLEKITALSNNIAAALKAERIHILAPVPGKSSVGVEVPNAVKTKVIMRDLLESDEWRGARAKIPLALGKDVYGHPIVADLAEMPHLLIAGSTGSGKSVCINAIIASLLYRFSPDQLRFVMIDPKVVELQHYNLLPHLVVPVVTDPKKVILALRWVVNEMEKRYQIFARVGVRNIASFNSRPNKKLLPREPELPLMARKEKVEPGAEGFAVEVDEEIVVPRDDDIVIPEKLSYIVVIIDELADLMLVAPADVEMAIARVTQMARAAGIHCIVATQRPSVDVITGVIKANIPARVAFQVAAKVDSRTILDAMGADKLLGKGDMLYLPPGSAKLIRAQGALITDQEIAGIVEFIARQGKPNYDLEIHQQLSKPSGSDVPSGIDEDEELIQECIEVIRSEQKASVSLLQRRLRLGYTRAARIMDELENRGIVGPSKGAEPRDILLDLDAPAPAPGPGEQAG